jgi:hypothetical protein
MHQRQRIWAEFLIRTSTTMIWLWTLVILVVSFDSCGMGWPGVDKTPAPSPTVFSTPTLEEPEPNVIYNEVVRLRRKLVVDSREKRKSTLQDSGGNQWDFAKNEWYKTRGKPK